MKRIILTLLLLGLAPVYVGAKAEVADISGTNYFPTVHRVLKNAETSITAALYQVRTSRNSLPDILVGALIDAHTRGVKVKVVLDRSRHYNPETKKLELDTKNDNSYNKLHQAGVAVFFASPLRTMHSKVVVVDGRTVILGSANWTQSAFTKNIESSTLITSPALAKTVLAQIESIALVKQTDTLNLSVRVPNEAILNPDLAPYMLSKHDERAFDTYLLLLKQVQSANSENDTVQADYAALAVMLDIDHMARTDYRRQITKTLRKLESKYELLECEFAHGKDASIRMLPTPRSNAKADGYFNVPYEYWDFGWHRTLSHSAKFADLLQIWSFPLHFSLWRKIWRKFGASCGASWCI